MPCLRPRTLLRRATVLVFCSTSALALWACGEQGEGERCDPNNGPLDCEGGLECRPSSELNIEGRGVGLCCPPAGIPPNVDACLTSTTLPDEPDAGIRPPVDSGSPSPVDSGSPSPSDSGAPPSDSGGAPGDAGG